MRTFDRPAMNAAFEGDVGRNPWWSR